MTLTARQIYFINLARKKNGASLRTKTRSGMSKATRYTAEKLSANF